MEFKIIFFYNIIIFLFKINKIYLNKLNYIFIKNKIINYPKISYEICYFRNFKKIKN